MSGAALLPDEVDALIVGAGPSGLAAATELAPHMRVLVLDREPQAGGIPRHCGHYPFGLREFRRLMRGPDYARALVARAEAAGARIVTGVDVVALHPGPAVSVTSDAGPSRISTRQVLLATGVRESSRVQRMVGGEKPGAILPTGALQGMVYLEGRRPFQRPVIFGSELVSFSAIMTCRHAGIHPVAMIEPRAQAIARWPAALYPRLMGIPLLLSTRLVAIEGRERVEAVVVEGPKGQRRIEADGVIVSGRFRSEATLLATSHLARDPATGGPRVDSLGRCSDGAYLAIGNMLHPAETSGWCWAEGRAVARSILAGRVEACEAPVSLGSDALAWALPQVIGPGSGADPLDRLQVRVNRPVRGRLVLSQNGRPLASRHIDSRPERRILLSLPKALGDAPVTLTLEET